MKIKIGQEVSYRGKKYKVIDINYSMRLYLISDLVNIISVGEEDIKALEANNG